MLADLLRRPWEATGPGVSARLAIFAPLGALSGESDQPGEVNGLPITAAALRELLARLHALRTDSHLHVPPGTTLALTDPNGALRAAVSVEQLTRLANRGCVEHPAGDCGCPLLEAPPGTEAYEPTAAQRIWVKTRDRTCRFPNCAQRVGWADLDHVIAHACGGETTCTNLCCLCRSHHRLKTRRSDWHFTMTADGVLTVTTPSGITRTTRPPGLRPPSEPTLEADSPPQPPAAAEDPPPF